MEKQELKESEIQASQPVTVLPFENWEGNDGSTWAISIGVGDPAVIQIVRNGNEAVRKLTFQKLIEFFNH